MFGSIFIQICAVGSKRRIFSAPECVLAVQGHPRSMIWVPIESAYATSYLSPIVTIVLSCTVSEIRRLIGYELPIFFYPSLIRRPCSLCYLWNLAVKLSIRKLVMGLSSSETPWS